MEGFEDRTIPYFASMGEARQRPLQNPRVSIIAYVPTRHPIIIYKV